MPKTEWRVRIKKERTPMARPKFFRTKEEEDQWKEKERKRAQFEIWERSEYRAIAKRAMDDLTIIMTYLPNVSKHPERDYTKIFADGDLYLAMMVACDQAHQRTFKARLKLRTKENLEVLQDALANAGLDHWNTMKLSDRRIWDKATRQLERKEAEDATPYYEMALRSRQAAHRAPSEISTELTKKVVARSKMLLKLWHEERELERKERTLELSESPEKGT